MKVHLNVLKVDTPVMLASSVLLMAVLHDLYVSRVEGIFLFAGIIAYMTFTIITARRTGETKVDFPLEQLTPKKKVTPVLDIILL